MARVKRGTVSRRKHKKLLLANKGFRGTKSRLTKVAHEAHLHAGAYAYQGRKNRKRDMRGLWILRIGEAAKQEGTSYSVLMNKFKKTNVLLDRKILSEIIATDRETFSKIVQDIK